MRWIVIYPVDSDIQRLKKLGLEFALNGLSEKKKPKGHMLWIYIKTKADKRKKG